MRVVTDQLSMSLRKAELDAPMIQSLCGFGYHHINH
jgi:hypothetical protein